MANPEHLAILKQGIEQWNRWRDNNSEIAPDLVRADLVDIDLRGANLCNVILCHANLRNANLDGVNFIQYRRTN